MKTAEIKAVVVIPDRKGIIQYSWPHCCTEGKVIQEEFAFEVVSKVAKGIIVFQGINKVCGNCGKTFSLVGTDVIKDTLRPYL